MNDDLWEKETRPSEPKKLEVLPEMTIQARWEPDPVKSILGSTDEVSIQYPDGTIQVGKVRCDSVETVRVVGHWWVRLLEFLRIKKPEYEISIGFTVLPEVSKDQVARRIDQ